MLEEIKARRSSCQSSWAEPDSTCALCSKDFFPVRSGPKNCASGCANGQKSRGSSYLHRILRRLDRTAAEKIHANDTPKLIRAIEVCLASRQKMTDLWQQHGRDPLRGFRILRLGLDPDRQALYDRINRRAQQMFEAGLIEETQRLLEKYGDAAGPAVFARLQAGRAIPSRRTHARAGRCKPLNKPTATMPSAR